MQAQWFIPYDGRSGWPKGMFELTKNINEGSRLGFLEYVGESRKLLNNVYRLMRSVHRFSWCADADVLLPYAGRPERARRG